MKNYPSLNQPSECNTYADIDAVYKCLKEQYEVKDEQLILYGQSVGSGPTVDLASHTPNLRAVVLHGPILSGLRVLYPLKHTHWFDIYKNVEKISLVNCPVLVIHVSCLLFNFLILPFPNLLSFLPFSRSPQLNSYNL
ncbi:hypothetical protein AABB24_005055 [Solanum stoloniferum]|uniref:Serine aminopeptidase S33 domain-containing protein n=1 Tax=Solanum stoloniferum TaxID=62892 RepID=A0ABD2UWL6_9SOLN